MQAPFSISWVETISLASLVTAEQDEKISRIVRQAALAEDEADELDQALAERFILEGCVYDAKKQALYVGMENLGIWTIDLSPRLASPELLLTVEGSWTDFSDWYKPGQARITDDIEGMDILHRGDRSYLIFSSQGISEFSAFDLQEKRWIGNFKIKYGKNDPVTITDGLAIYSGSLGAAYPEGLMIVHDDRNTSDDESMQNANYKLLGLQKVWAALGID
jgi:3-phytase